MAKTNRTASSRDLRVLFNVPQHDLQAQILSRLHRRGFPTLKPAQIQLLLAITVSATAGVRLSDLVAEVSLPKQTVGDLIAELEAMRMVERFPDPEHGVIKRVRLGPKGKRWAAEVKRVSSQTEARWAGWLGMKKMRSLRALLEELATTVEHGRNGHGRNGHGQKGHSRGLNGRTTNGNGARVHKRG